MGSERVPTLGAAEVTVQFKDQTKQLPVVVVAGPGPNLLGRSWIKELGMNCVLLNSIEHKHITLQEVQEKKVKVELERLTNQGIIEPGKLSEWAAPIVPVLKPDNCASVEIISSQSIWYQSWNNIQYQN